MGGLRTPAVIGSVSGMDMRAVLADAARLLHEDVYRQLHLVEDLADSEWSEDEVDLAHELISELVVIVRHVLAGHRADATGGEAM
jgi:hypothetical protein